MQEIEYIIERITVQRQVFQTISQCIYLSADCVKVALQLRGFVRSRD